MANIDYRQDKRLMQFSTPVLPKDTLLIENFHGSEGISTLFEFHAYVFSRAETAIDPKKLVGAKATVALELDSAKGKRWFNGVIAAFVEGMGNKEFDSYKAHIVPSMWQLTLNRNSRSHVSHEAQTVMDIVKKVIEPYGLSISDQTKATYPKLEYCTQYNESDFSFISRLLEQHGIFYWFDHSETDNKIVFGDGREAYKDCKLSSSLVYAPFDVMPIDAEGCWTPKWEAVASLVTGQYSTQDYEYRNYSTPNPPKQSSASDYGGTNVWESFVSPAGAEGYVKNVDKEESHILDLEKVFLTARRSAIDATAEVFSGTSNLPSMATGYTFDLTRHPTKSDWNQKYLLTRLTHSIGQLPPYRSLQGDIEREGYHNELVAIPARVVFKPQQTTPKPRIYGPQTATVVAPSGEEFFIDKLGRVCVQFRWDRERPSGTMDNTWVRVAQPWAGSGWGTFFWPRLNDEVVVQFLDGDPDNPVVVGSLYNGVNVPKYELPDMSTRSGLVTRSSKGGTKKNANELRFEDKTGSEQIFINAERDMDHRIEHDSRRYVGVNDSLIVKGSQYEEVTKDRHADIQGNTVDKIGGKSDINITSDLNEKIGGNYSLKVGGNHGEKVGKNYAVDAGVEVYIKAGMKLVIESGVELCLKGSGGFITIGPAGIAISGTMVMINSGGAAVAGSPAELTDPGNPTKPDEADDGSKGGKNS